MDLLQWAEIKSGWNISTVQLHFSRGMCT